MELLKTPLTEKHIELGATMVDFSGWNMPIQYSSIKEEHLAVREDVGIFDVSHMGEIIVSGEDSENFTNYLITNDIKSIEVGQCLYTFMCYQDGGVVDDLIVYRLREDEFMFVVNASNIEKDYEWMLENSNKFDVEIKNISDSVGLLAIQGPNSTKYVSEVLNVDLSEVRSFSFVKKDGIIISRTGYTGEDGFEIYSYNENTVKLWEEFTKLGVRPCGLGSRDTLRFEAGLPLYSNELSKDINPLEALLSMFVKLDKDNFIGLDSLKKIKETGVKKKVVGLELDGKAIARHGCEVYSNDNKLIGYVTTGYRSISFNISLAFSYIDSNYANIGDNVSVIIRNKVVSATVTTKRFLNNYRNN